MDYINRFKSRGSNRFIHQRPASAEDDIYKKAGKT
jgi:hypothetical protein